MPWRTRWHGGQSRKLKNLASTRRQTSACLGRGCGCHGLLAASTVGAALFKTRSRALLQSTGRLGSFVPHCNCMLAPTPRGEKTHHVVLIEQAQLQGTLRYIDLNKLVMTFLTPDIWNKLGVLRGE